MFRIRVVAGGELDKDGKYVDHREVSDRLNTIEAYASDRFGGITRYDHAGSWREGPDIVTEQGHTFEILNQTASEAFDFARFVRKTLDQKSVILTVEVVTTSFVID